MRMGLFTFGAAIFLLIGIEMVNAADEETLMKGILFGDSDGLTVITLDTSDLSTLNTNTLRETKPIFLDFDYRTGAVYFSNQNRLHISINKINLNGSDEEVLFSLDHESAAEGVAIDWVAQNLYWVTPGKHKISVSRLDGSYLIDIVTGLGDPRAVCVDPQDGYMYWSDWGEEPVIARAFLDGTGRVAIVTEDLGYPNGLALDLEERKLYWGDAFFDRIEVCDLDGSNRRPVITDGLGHVFGVSILDDRVYWSDWETRTVERANKMTGEQRETVYNAGSRVMGVKAVDMDVGLDETNSCGINNGGCSHLCLYRPPPLRHACACPEGMALEPDTRGNGGVCIRRTVPDIRVSTRGYFAETTPPLNVDTTTAIGHGHDTTVKTSPTTDRTLATTEAKTRRIDVTTKPTEAPIECPPCDKPMTKNSAFDYLCQLDNPTVLTAKLRGGRFDFANRRIIVGTPYQKRILKSDGPIPEGMEVSLKMDQRCHCLEEMRPGQRYLVMGEMDGGMLAATYVVQTSHRVMLDIMITFEHTEHTCEFHRWTKLKEHLQGRDWPMTT